MQNEDPSMPAMQKRTVRPRSRAARTRPERTEADTRRVGINSAPPPRDGVDRAEASRDFTASDSDMQTITRKSRSERSEELFSIPEHRKKPGWDYQFWPLTVLNQPVDRSRMQEIHAGGWRPVPAEHFPELQIPGVDDEYIETMGQRLYMRPAHLTDEARREEFDAAERQKRDRIQSAMDGRPSGHEGLRDVRGIEVRPQGVTIEGEVGVQSGRTPVR